MQHDECAEGIPWNWREDKTRPNSGVASCPLPAAMSTPRLQRRTQTEEEDAASLKLGNEFNNAGCLLISEVKLLLDHRRDNAPDTACAHLLYSVP